jgi:hypothetical protein
MHGPTCIFCANLTPSSPQSKRAHKNAGATLTRKVEDICRQACDDLRDSCTAEDTQSVHPNFRPEATPYSFLAMLVDTSGGALEQRHGFFDEDGNHSEFPTETCGIQDWQVYMPDQVCSAMGQTQTGLL